MCVGCKMHLAKYCCQHLKKVERIFNAPLTKVKCKGVVKLSASSVNYKGIIATHSIGGGLALATMHTDAIRLDLVWLSMLGSINVLLDGQVIVYQMLYLKFKYLVKHNHKAPLPNTSSDPVFL